MDAEIKILIADDHPIFRKGLLQVIEVETDLHIVAEAEDGLDAYTKIKALRPAIAVLDVSMPKMDGFQVARKLRDDGSDVGIIFLTAYKDEDLFNEALEVGAKGYVLKNNALSDILNSIRTVAAGEYYISPTLSSFMVTRRASETSSAKDKPNLKDLTPTELRILKLIAQAKTNKEIAQELFISHRTVENHRANICMKLDLHGTNALTRFVLEHKGALTS
jgi:DNA-binding NarL/FixJ family response regulator